jgi:hypothetical protein
MKLTVMEIMLIVDTLKGSLEIANGYGKNFNFSDEDREKVLKHLLSLADATCITLEGKTGGSNKK